jgi:hypothetical protein
MQLTSSAGKYGNVAKRGKTCKRCQARENVQTLRSAGKRAIDAKLGIEANSACFF